MRRNGERWIVAELRTHGITEAKARELIESAEPDWPELIRRQLWRRYGGKGAKDFAVYSDLPALPSLCKA